MFVLATKRFAVQQSLQSDLAEASTSGASRPLPLPLGLDQRHVLQTLLSAALGQCRAYPVQIDLKFDGVRKLVLMLVKICPCADIVYDGKQCWHYHWR